MFLLVRSSGNLEKWAESTEKYSETSRDIFQGCPNYFFKVEIIFTTASFPFKLNCEL